MATATKHKQRSRYSYHNQMRGQTFDRFKANNLTAHYMKKEKSLFAKFFSMFRKKGEK